MILGSEKYDYKYSLSKSRVIYGHSYDYDRYLRNQRLVKPSFIPEEEYYVHLVNSPWKVHGYVLLDVDSTITKDEYKGIINKFHDFLEEETGKKIVIAAYPKARPEENIYNGRPFIYHNTEQLVKYSSGVICHHTGAINFAVIHKKPICLVSLRKLDMVPVFHYSTIAFAKALDLEIQYIDSDEDLERVVDTGIFVYNGQAYEDYTKKYLKTDQSGERLLWDTVCDVLCEDR